MKPSKFLHRAWNRQNNQQPCRAGMRPRCLLMVEGLEDRTVPATLPTLGALPSAAALGNLSAITNSVAAPAASPAASAASAASALTDVASALQNLTTDLTKTLQDVIADLNDVIKLVGDTGHFDPDGRDQHAHH